MMLSLFLQTPAAGTWSADWWLATVEKYGYSGSVMILVIWLLWKYAPRAIDAVLASINTNTESTKTNAESTRQLVEMQRGQQDAQARIVSTQEAQMLSSSKLVDLHAAMCAREEAIVSRGCDLIDLVTSRVTPQLLPEVKRHTDALRELCHKKARD